MLTKPEYWDELWGADGTRCSYRILIPASEPPQEGTYILDQDGAVWQITSISSTEMTILKVTDESLFDRVLYTCDMGFVIIGGNSMSTTIEDISWFLLYTGDDDIEEESLILDKPVFTAAKPIGNTPCFTMECCLRQKEADIPKGAWLELQIRLQNSTQSTDWVSLGKFKVNKRVKYPDGWVKLSCRDRMQMANQLFIKDESVDVTTWPKPMNEVMSMSLDTMGITLDPSTTINEGEGWVVSLPLGLSIRTIWSSIAAAHGGNFIITPQDTLKLIQPRIYARNRVQVFSSTLEPSVSQMVFDPSEIETNEKTLAVGDWIVVPSGKIYVVSFIEDYGIEAYYDETLYLDPSESPVSVELFEDGFELLGDPVTVDRLTLSTNELHIMAGDSGDNNIDVECLYASAEAAMYAKSQLEGLLYTPVKCSSMVFDPLAEVYDTFLVNEVLTTWSQLTVKCGIVPLADGVADTSAEPASEYGFEDTPLNEIKSQIKAVSESIDAADRDSFDKVTQEELFNKLTNNGTSQGLFFVNGQIFINAAYLASGTIQADLIKSGVLASKDGSFSLNLDTGEFTITGMASQSDLNALRQEGVEKIVTPVMKYSMSDDGLRIQKPGEEIGNKMTHEGMEVSRGSEPMLRADKDGVIATDVTVRNFLNMGENSRFEDYSDGVDTARTGCFAM